MDRDNPLYFIKSAEGDLASLRSSLLIVAQTGDASDLTIARRNLTRLHAEALAGGLGEVAEAASACLKAIDAMAQVPKAEPAAVYAALDLVARIEAAVWKTPLASGEFLKDVSGFVDASFDEIMPRNEEAEPDDRRAEVFEIDEETLDIFRSEADELLGNISRNLTILAKSPADQNALWEIRRNAHTFKGAAGIVGLTQASNIAHRMEDLLDKLVELRFDASAAVRAFLTKCSEQLNAIAAAKTPDESVDLEAYYSAAMTSLATRADASAGTSSDREVLQNGSIPARADNYRPASAPIVRVSLDRLDDLLKVSRTLLINRSALAERLTELSAGTMVDIDTVAKLQTIFSAQRRLTDELHAKLLQIRMVKFGTLETRLSRAVHVTCLDENKKATVELENADVEIDTQILDALIEPLLHLLKNAVVHGIEGPETRRLIGKAETGTIRIRIEADDEALVLCVSDDGGGISIPKLKEKAISHGVIGAGEADSLDDRAAIKLIFDRGLTTAEKVDLNAGRGVGMSIVKESVESRGGSVLVESEPQRGTTFTILLPLSITRSEPDLQEPDEAAAAEPRAPLVLVVDDSASVRRHAVKMVEQAGLRVITANNGADALELLLSGEWEPDLILSDIEMPQIDGWEFLQYVKTDANFGHIPVVMVTSLDTDEDRARANDLGAVDYIIKPFKEADLTRILERHGIAALV